MWAVVEIKNKQFKVRKGDELLVGRLKQEGDIVLDKVLLLYRDKKTEIGTPYLKGVKVKASILGEEKSQKIVVYKYRRRKKYRRKKGHRQVLTRLKILDIIAS